MKKRYKRTFLVLYAFCSLLAGGVSAQSLILSLEKTISLAADSSLEAFRTRRKSAAHTDAGTNYHTGGRQFAGRFPIQKYVSGRLLGIPDLQGRPSAKPYPKSDAGTIPPLFYPTI